MTTKPVSALTASMQALAQAREGEKIINLALDLIDPDPNQPRKTFHELTLEELAASIRAACVHSPICVTRRGSRFLIVYGERRWRASQMADKPTIPVVVREYSDLQIKAVRLIENRQRDPVSPIEEAAAIKDLVDVLGGAHGAQKQAADMLGISEEKVSQSLRLIAMPETIKEAFDAGHISDATMAVDVARVHAVDPAAAGALVEKAKTGDLKRAEVRETVKATKEKAGKEKRAPAAAETPAPTRCDKTADMWAEGGDFNDSAKDSPVNLSVWQNPLNEQQYAVLSDLLDEIDDQENAVVCLAAVVRVVLSRGRAFGHDENEILAAVNGCSTEQKEPGHGR